MASASRSNTPLARWRKLTGPDGVSSDETYDFFKPEDGESDPGTDDPNTTGPHDIPGGAPPGAAAAGSRPHADSDHRERPREERRPAGDGKDRRRSEDFAKLLEELRETHGPRRQEALQAILAGAGVAMPAQDVEGVDIKTFVSNELADRLLPPKKPRLTLELHLGLDGKRPAAPPPPPADHEPHAHGASHTDESHGGGHAGGEHGAGDADLKKAVGGLTRALYEDESGIVPRLGRVESDVTRARQEVEGLRQDYAPPGPMFRRARLFAFIAGGIALVALLVGLIALFKETVDKTARSSAQSALGKSLTNEAGIEAHSVAIKGLQGSQGSVLAGDDVWETGFSSPEDCAEAIGVGTAFDTLTFRSTAEKKRELVKYCKYKMKLTSAPPDFLAPGVQYRDPPPPPLPPMPPPPAGRSAPPIDPGEQP